jgi:hypothetical protein
MQHQPQLIAFAGSDVELSQENKKHIPYPCIHFKHLADELVSETTKRRRMKILVGTRNIILLEHNRNNQ